jgi:hypothetical protein
MAGNIQSIPETEARQLGEWLLTQFEKLPGTTKVNRSSIPQADLVRLGKDALHQVAQQYSHYVTPTAGSMGTTPSQRTPHP